MVGTRKLQMLSAALAALSFITAFCFYPMMPDRVASHWNIEGKADGHMDRGIGTYFVPVLAALMLALFYFLPRIDPMRKNYGEFQEEYDGMVALIIGFLYYVYILTIAYNLGYRFNLMQFLAPGFGALFIYVGVVLAKARQNWFVGIRTPWTLSSEKVWGKTHALGSKLFMAAGVVALLGVVLPQMLVASIAVVLAAAIATFVYSYFEYRKEKAQPGPAEKEKRGKKK